MRHLSPLLALTLWAALPAVASAADEHEHHHQHPAPAATPMPMDMDHHDHAAMGHDPLMARARAMGSGTSGIPALSPMRMWSWRGDDWLWMVHGDLVGGLNYQGGPRGAAISPTWAGENWEMAMGSRYLGPGILDVRAMTSLEPFTLPAGGTPQLFQTGESYLGQPLVDRQHPHDLFMELTGRYTWNLADQTALFLYGGPVGEPALGPSAFMHRPSAADNHWAPLAHHLQDSTHYVYGVATAGVKQGPFQLEGSVFNGTEPDENRVGFDFGPMNSWSTRLSWFPTPNWALQASYGQLKNPERLAPGDVHRTTASLINVQEYDWGWWSSALIWGQNHDFHGDGEQVLQSYGMESQVDQGFWHGYGRLELVDKVGLGLTAAHEHEIHRVGALTVGGIRDFDWSDAFDLGLGADATVYSIDQDTQAVYGGNPVSFRVYLRLRPPTMQH